MNFAITEKLGTSTDSIKKHLSVTVPSTLSLKHISVCGLSQKSLMTPSLSKAKDTSASESLVSFVSHRHLLPLSQKTGTSSSNNTLNEELRESEIKIQRDSSYIDQTT